jgi:hypothetical protein
MNTDRTRIIWDGDGVRARVNRVLANGQEEWFDGGVAADPQTGDFNGQRNTDIKLGEVLEFRLRQANAAGTLLASVTVTTNESPILPLAADPRLSSQAARGQGIYRLSISPGVDSVTMSFRTRQPTNPFVEIFNKETGEIAGLWARPDIQTRHRMDFEGWKRPFAQDTEHSYRIVARPMPGGWGGKDEVTGSFRTGTRTVTFFFDRIHVRNDGDPNSPGEFTFAFGAGDVETREQLGTSSSMGRPASPTATPRK